MLFGFIKHNNNTEREERLIAVLDIGSSKISVVVASVSPVVDDGGEPLNSNGDEEALINPNIKIIGYGTVASRGVKKGEVVNIEAVTDAVRRAIRKAENSSGVQIGSVYLSLTGRHFQCMESSGVIAVKEKEIGQKEVDSVIEAASAVAIPFDREIIHVIPVTYSVNGQNGISDPKGMSGVRLETEVQIITASSSSVQNILRCCERAGLEVVDIVFQPLASAVAVLSEDEKDIGVAVINIGGGTSDMAVFTEGTFCHSCVITVGGNNFTNDLAIGLRIPSLEAEDLKRAWGCALLSLAGDEIVEFTVGDRRVTRKIPRHYIVEILQPRAEELLTLLRDEIRAKGLYKSLNAGIVLTGGGSLLEGMDVLAENILGLPVRVGYPRAIEGMSREMMNPAYSATIGLVLHACMNLSEENGQGAGKSLKAKMKKLVHRLI